MPTGAVMPWGTASAPTDWLLCDGSAVSRTTYATLFAVIGTTFGVGDNSTTFNVPNLKGRTPVGKSADTEFDTIGETGGEKTHTLTEAEMAKHKHSLTCVTAGSSRGGASGGGENQGSDKATSDVGSGTAHNNLQPYITINFIIKV